MTRDCQQQSRNLASALEGLSDVVQLHTEVLSAKLQDAAQAVENAASSLEAARAALLPLQAAGASLANILSDLGAAPVVAAGKEVSRDAHP